MIVLFGNGSPLHIHRLESVGLLFDLFAEALCSKGGFACTGKRFAMVDGAIDIIDGLEHGSGIFSGPTQTIF